MSPPHRAVALLDLTSLTGEETEAEIAELCAKAQTPAGPVAAVCVYPGFAARCARELAGTPIAVAAVANFPAGEPDPERARRDAAQAVEAGAGEVDVVLPWRTWLAGEPERALETVHAAREATPGALKVILESGSLGDARTVRAAADAALAAGADFVKTSTGKHGPGASLEAGRAMLEAVRDAGHGGFKASGGVRAPEDAEAYLALADELLGPDWTTPRTFRIGASSLLDALL